MNDPIKLNNPDAVLTPGDFYGLVVADPLAPQDTDTGDIDTIYAIDLIKHDLPKRMRYIQAVSEDEYIFTDKDPAISHNVSDIRGLSVRFDRRVPVRESDGLYVSDPFAGDADKTIKKQLAKNKQHRKASKAKEDAIEADLNLA